MQSGLLTEIVERYDGEKILKADGFDDAVIGIDEKSLRLIYSVSKTLEILVNEGMSEIDAEEHFSYNVSEAILTNDEGECISPIWCEDTFNY